VTLSDIRKAVAAYLHKGSVNNLIAGGVDLCLVALNQVRTAAELGNDFEFTRKLMSVSVDGVTGGDLSTAVEYGTTNNFAIKSVLDVGTFDTNGNFRPAEWTTTGDSLNRERLDNPFFIARYPTDAQVSSGLIGQKRFVFSGNRVYFFPKTPNLTILLGIEAYTFTGDWADYTDPAAGTLAYVWTRQGAQYLQWAATIHLNHLWRDFVFRQEGNLPPPQALADAGLAALQTWDSFRYQQFRRHSR